MMEASRAMFGGDWGGGVPTKDHMMPKLVFALVVCSKLETDDLPSRPSDLVIYT